MTPDAIKQKEESFTSTLKDSAGTVFKKIKETYLSSNCSIADIRPEYDSYFYKEKTEKKCICLHFTVGSIKGDIATLTKKDNKVSVNYVIDRLGNIYHLFDDEFWSYHLGSAAIGGNSVMSKRTIGIEVSNYGPLKKSADGSFIDAYGAVYTKDESEVENCEYRGYEHFAKMTEEQVRAINYLLLYLCDKHKIPYVFKENIDEVFESSTEARNFCGIYAHTSLRKDKFDFPRQMLKDIIPDDIISEEPPKIEKTEPEIPSEPKSEIKEEKKEETTKQNLKPSKPSFFEMIIEIFKFFFTGK